MKKYAGMLVALMFILLAVTGLAQEYYTLPEIREQAAAGWHETYTDKYGRMVQVDIDIDVFGGDQAPVVKADVPEFVEYRYHAGYPYDSVTDVARKGGKRTHPYRTYGEEVNLDKAYGADYGNDLTVREAYDFLAELLEEHGHGYSVDDFILNPPDNFDVVYSKMVATGEVHVPALYNITLWQQMHGLPIIIGAEWGFKNEGTRSYDPRLFFQMRNKNEKEHSLILRPLREVEVLAEDIPLCSVEKVIRSIEGWIEGGYVQHVMLLQFGYVIYSDPTIQNFRKSNSIQEEESFYLVPSWVLVSIFSSNPKEYDKIAIDALNPDDDRFGEYTARSYLIINAQTGKVLDYFDTSKNGGGDGSYKGFISWEDVR
ncbi:MAG: hypothetical protein Q4F18_07360 [Clostridia bacterium]|nr:hypothetical protein [Clostridia bacterium]